MVGSLLKRWRGKKVLMFVGDSLSLESIVEPRWLAMIHGVGANPPRNLFQTGNAAHMLPLRSKMELTLYLYQQTPHTGGYSKEKKGRVFEIGFHTNKSGTNVQDGPKVSKDWTGLLAFYKGLTTWARWVDQNVDVLAKTKVFFARDIPALNLHFGFVSACPLEKKVNNSLVVTLIMCAGTGLVLLTISDLAQPRVFVAPNESREERAWDNAGSLRTRKRWRLGVAYCKRLEVVVRRFGLAYAKPVAKWRLLGLCVRKTVMLTSSSWYSF
nr:protein trichome birefringence-like 38 [Ipomoea batatas]